MITKCGICGAILLPETMVCTRKCFDFCDPDLYRLFRYEVNGITIAIFRLLKSDMLKTQSALTLAVQWSLADTFTLGVSKIARDTTIVLAKPGDPKTTEFLKDHFIELEL